MIFESQKAKSSISRLYQKHGKEEKETSTDLDKYLSNAIRVQRQWEKRNGYTKEEEGKIQDSPGMVFISKNDTNQNEYAIIIRVRNIEERVVKGHDLKSAKEVYNQTVKGKIDEGEWWSVDSYISQAKKILVTLQKTPDAEVSFSNRYGFLFAIEEVLSLGFSLDGIIVSKERTQGDGNKKSLASLRRRLCDSLQNSIVPPHPTVVANECMNAIIKTLRLELGKKIKERTFMGYAFMMVTTLERSSRKLPTKYAYLKTASEILFKDALNYEKNNVSKSGMVGTLLPTEPHDFIPVEKLDKLLDIAFSVNFELYNFIILSLSVGLRPTEVEKLVQEPQKYMTTTGALSFQTTITDAESIDTLISKTDIKKRDPQLSVISNIILKYFRPRRNPPNFFSLKTTQKSFREQHPELRNFYERTLRTTCATMLAYSSISKIGPITLNAAKNRFGHKDMTELITRYAVEAPADFMPEKYLNIYGLKLDGIDIGNGSVIWDMWLLRHWIMKFKEATLGRGNNEEYSKIKEFVFKEVALFQKRMTSDTDSEVPTDL